MVGRSIPSNYSIPLLNDGNGSFFLLMDWSWEFRLTVRWLFACVLIFLPHSKTSVTECSSIQIGMIPSILPELGTCFRMRIFDRDRSFSVAINYIHTDLAWSMACRFEARCYSWEHYWYIDFQASRSWAVLPSTVPRWKGTAEHG